MNEYDNDDVSRPFAEDAAENDPQVFDSIDTATSLPVHTLSKGSVHTLSDVPVHTLSKSPVQMTWTGYEQSMDTLTEQTMDRGNGQGVNTPNEQSVDTPSGQPEVQSVATAPPAVLLRDAAVKWTSNQKMVSDFFRKASHCVINYTTLGEKLDIPYGTLRNIIRRLTEAGLIRCKPFRDKAIQGLEVWYCGTAEVFPTSSWTGCEQPPHIKERKIDSNKFQEEEYKKINQSIWNLSTEQIEKYWPNARRAGLFSGHLRDAKEAFETQQFFNEQSEAVVAQTLRYLDWQLGKGPILDSAGKTVGNPILYWLRSLQRKGYYGKPNGYIDHELLALELLEKEQNEILAAKRRILENEAEMEKLAREEELSKILQELAEKGEAHPHWQYVYENLGDWAKGEIRATGSKGLLKPGNSASARIALRRLLGYPS